MSAFLPLPVAHVGALHTALVDAGALGVDMDVFRLLTLRSLLDGVDPHGAEAAQLAPAASLLDEAMAALAAANQAADRLTG